jgi:hypothetical protein
VTQNDIYSAQESEKKQQKDSITAPRLLRAERGFLSIMWGILLFLLLFFNAISIHIPGHGLIPSYLLGSVVIYVGILYLYSAGVFTVRGHRLLRWMGFALFLHIYFAPFVMWWQAAPQVTYFFLNVIGLLTCAVWILFLTNKIAREMGYAFKIPSLQTESYLSLWAFFALLILPCVLFISYCAAVAVKTHSTLQAEMLMVLYHLPRWEIMLLLVPVALTMSICWKAKQACIHLATGTYKETP